MRVFLVNKYISGGAVTMLGVVGVAIGAAWDVGVVCAAARIAVTQRLAKIEACFVEIFFAGEREERLKMAFFLNVCLRGNCTDRLSDYFFMFSLSLFLKSARARPTALFLRRARVSKQTVSVSSAETEREKEEQQK